MEEEAARLVEAPSWRRCAWLQEALPEEEASVCTEVVIFAMYPGLSRSMVATESMGAARNPGVSPSWSFRSGDDTWYPARITSTGSSVSWGGASTDGRAVRGGVLSDVGA